MSDVAHAETETHEKPPAKPLAIKCYAAFSDGIMRGVWIDMNMKILHIEPTPLMQVKKGMMQILDPNSFGTIETSGEKELPLVESNIEPNTTNEVAEDARQRESGKRRR